MNTAYWNNPIGVEGNEDCGQMSAWYLFSALGFYPINPASGDYMIGSAIFSKTILHLANGKTFTISAPESSTTNLYIQSAELNGKPLTIPVVRYSEIQQGGTLSFKMGSTPSKWASDWHPAPLPRYPESAVQ